MTSDRIVLMNGLTMGTDLNVLFKMLLFCGFYCWENLIKMAQQQITEYKGTGV